MSSFHFVLVGGQTKQGNLPLPTSFDRAYLRLEQTPGVHIEPDGSFTWNGLAGERVEGQLFDQGNLLNCVELRGECQKSSLVMLATIFGHPSAQLMLQCNQTGTVMPFSELLA